MKKIILFALFVLLSFSSVSFADSNKTAKCKIVSIKDSIVTLDCGKDVSHMKADMEVEVTTNKSEKKENDDDLDVMEGC